LAYLGPGWGTAHHINLSWQKATISPVSRFQPYNTAEEITQTNGVECHGRMDSGYFFGIVFNKIIHVNNRRYILIFTKYTK